MNSFRAMLGERFTSGLRLAMATIVLSGIGIGLGCSSVADGMRSLGTSKSDIKSQVMMARLMEHQGHYAKAQEVYEQLLRKSPRNAEVHHRLALVDHRLGRKDEAEQHFRKAVEVNPVDAGLLNDFGYWLYLQNRFPEAEQQLKTAIHNDPTNKMIANNLALALGRQGKVDQAERIYERTASAAETQANLGYLYAQLGQLDKSRNHYARAIELDPQNKTAVDALAQLPDAGGGPAAPNPALRTADVDKADLVAPTAEPMRDSRIDKVNGEGGLIPIPSPTPR